MKQNETLSKAFDYFNQTLFKNELPKVILNFSRAGKSTCGFFAPNHWEDETEKVHEISLCPNFLTKKRTHKEIYSTLVHEMAHLWQQDFGKPSRGGYHNKQWSVKMLEVGLKAVSNSDPSKQTGQSCHHEIIQDGVFDVAFDEIDKNLLLPFSAVEPNKKKKGTRTKYTCPTCGAILYGKQGLRVECLDCEAIYSESTE